MYIGCCGSQRNAVRDACCAGVDCASDGYPTVCFVSGGRYGAGSICEQAVLEGALQTCPLLFLNDSRLQGLYSVRTASLIAAPHLRQLRTLMDALAAGLLRRRHAEPG